MHGLGDAYFVWGLELAIAAPENGDSEAASATNFGAGLMSVTKRWDVRATYWIVLDSDNIGGLLLLTGGYHF